MALKTADTQGSLSSPIWTQIIRKSLMTYLLSVVTVPVICFIFGWRSAENIGAGYIYGSLSLVLFGILILAGNRVPFQLSKFSFPKHIPPSFKRHQEPENDGSPYRDGGVRFFFMTLISGVLLFVTGLLVR